MSWTKPGQGGASPGPPQFGASAPAPQHQPAPQSYGNQQNVYGNYGNPGSNGPQQQQYWQTQAQQYGQPAFAQGQVFQQEFPPNANHFYQQPPSAAQLFNQNYNHGYVNPQQNQQQNYYQNQPQQNQAHQNFTQNAPHSDGWEDNWDWGWEETAKQAQRAQQASQPAPPAAPACNNANVIEESFGANDTWNWAADDNRDKEPPPPPPLDRTQTRPPPAPAPATVPAPAPAPNAIDANDETGFHALNSDVSTRPPAEDVRTLNDRDAVKERLPNLAAGRRVQLENLTPQWSIESQMSQESSEGPHTQSEGTYRSENRTDSASPPEPRADGANFDYSQPSPDDHYPPNDEWSRHSDEPALSRDHLADTLADMTLDNHGNAPDGEQRDSRPSFEPLPTAPAPSATPPLRPPSAPLAQPSVSTPAPAAPPPSFPPPSTSNNPFKSGAPFSHKATRAASGPGASAALTSPAVVGKAVANRAPFAFEANLETTPDNSERPDRPERGEVASPYRSAPPPPDNLEVAPRSDRNEYMQTEQLSSGDYGENAEYAPPPGLRRLVLGDEPPPGLARMVPGRPEPGERRYRQAEGRPRPPPPGEAGPEPRRPPPAERGSPGDGAAPAPARDPLMEGENLQDPEPTADAPPPPLDAPRRPSTTPPDSDRDRSFDGEPRRDRDRDRDRGRSSRDRDRVRDDEGRYSRSDRRAARDKERRERRDVDASPEARRARRAARPRYETEDTDYYSDRDRDRDRRGYRESSYAGKPPRGDSRRYHTTERDRPRRHDDRDRDRDRERDRDRDRYERKYRDIDPTRKYGSLRRERRPDDDDRRRGGESPGREATGTDEDMGSWGRRDRDRDRDRDRRRRERERKRVEPAYYDVSQYEYYERLRATDPVAYMELYKRLMAGQLGQYAAPYGPYEARDRDRDRDRASVHSGRSSTTGLKGNDTDLNTDASLNLQLEESTVRSERMTPFKYSTAHVKGSMCGTSLVVVPASYPVDGAPAVVRVLRPPGRAGGGEWPAVGPVRAAHTHKKSLLEYCQSRDASEGGADAAGYALLWDLLATMLRQNGVVVGTDIAELLMKNIREFEWKQPSNKSSHNESRRESSVSGSADDTDHDATQQLANDVSTRTESRIDEAAALEKYQEYLIYGNRQEALEWAMSHGLWGHALALAGAGGGAGAARERAAVSARFVASLAPHSPLRTLYAALAGATPPALHMAAWGEHGDWRAHAAVLVSNSAARGEQAARALLQLGDVLAARRRPYSAQAVWLCAGAGWAPHALAPHPPAPAHTTTTTPATTPARLSLLFADPSAASFAALLTPRAVIATEIYEYARSLSAGAGAGAGAGEGEGEGVFSLAELQVYRLGAALRLAEAGQAARALAYVEEAARRVRREPARYPPAFLRALAHLADRLKYHDPALVDGVGVALEGEGEGSTQQWIQDLQLLAEQTHGYGVGVGVGADGGVGAGLVDEPSQQSTPLHQPHYTPQHQLQLQQQQHYAWEQPQQYQQQQPDNNVNQTYADPLPPPVQQPDYYAPVSQDDNEQQQQLLQQQYDYNEWAPKDDAYTENSYWQQEQYSYGEGVGGGEDSRPQITMPGANANASTSAFGDDDDDRPRRSRDQKEAEGSDSSKSQPAKKDKQEGGKEGKGGWLGGILTKLSLRPPNQMILPDDKNPSIVWDEQHKRWKNLDGEDEAEQPPPPPPTARELAPLLTRQTASPPLQATPGAPPAAPPVSNIFKMQKGRHIKKAYVDVLNPGGAPPAPLPVPPAAPPAASPHNYFVPQPHQGGGYEQNQAE